MFGPNWQEITEPGVYGTLQMLEAAGPGNPTSEELTWPVVTPRLGGRGTAPAGPQPEPAPAGELPRVPAGNPAT